MSKDLYIKHMKPRKNSYYKQGVIDKRTLKKYASNFLDEPIIYRSGLELQFVQYCENNPSIRRWASEPMKIKYHSRLDDKDHDYYPDYVIENQNGDKVIVEVKPYNQTIKPDMTDTIWLKESWIKNLDKWNAAKRFADEHNMKFIIVTEKFFE